AGCLVRAGVHDAPPAVRPPVFPVHARASLGLGGEGRRDHARVRPRHRAPALGGADAVWTNPKAPASPIEHAPPGGHLPFGGPRGRLAPQGHPRPWGNRSVLVPMLLEKAPPSPK